MSTKYYLAGPMTGIPQQNIPAFRSAAFKLRTLWDLDIISPVELDGAEVEAEAMKPGIGPPYGPIAGHTYGALLGRDVRIVIDEVDGIILLPGWENSRGARIECYVGLQTHKRFYLYGPSWACLDPVSDKYIKARIV